MDNFSEYNDEHGKKISKSNREIIRSALSENSFSRYN